MYELPEYAAMIADTRRVDAYAAALLLAVKPGSVVVEVGAGIGFFAIMARKMGARRVIAIEPNRAFTLARSLATHNDAGDGIEFIQGVAKDVTLPEPADVLVADLRGALPVAADYLESMIDARDRLLRPGGTLIPMVDTLYAAVVQDPVVYGKLTPSWSAPGIEIDLGPLHRLTTNEWIKGRFVPEQLLTEPQPWAIIDYLGIVNPSVEGTVASSAVRDGTGHGLAVWFDSILIDGVTVSNAPGCPPSTWGMAFFPWSQPIDLKKDDRVRVHLEARHLRSEYVWRWDSDVWSRDSSQTPKARLRQCTFHNEPDPGALKKLASEYVPSLSEDGEMERFILHAVDGNTSNEEVARRLMEEFPRRFDKRSAALWRVADVVNRLGRA
jgi:protein arginine N-methyltransferase 1